MSCAVNYLFLGNQLALEYLLSGVDPATGAPEPPAEGSVSLTAFIGATIDAAAAIHASLSVQLTAGAAAGIYRRFHGAIDGSDIDAHLEALLGEDVYRIITDADGNFREAKKYQVARRTDVAPGLVPA